MAFLLEGKASEVAGTTYKTLMNIVDEISSCSYPEAKELTDVQEEEETVVESLPVMIHSLVTLLLLPSTSFPFRE